MKQSVNRAGIWLIVFSLPYLIVGIIALYGYFMLNTQLIALESELSGLPSEVGELIGDISIFSTVGMVILGLGIVSMAIWFLMIVIGILNLRRV